MAQTDGEEAPEHEETAEEEQEAWYRISQAQLARFFEEEDAREAAEAAASTCSAASEIKMALSKRAG